MASIGVLNQNNQIPHAVSAQRSQSVVSNPYFVTGCVLSLQHSKLFFPVALYVQSLCCHCAKLFIIGWGQSGSSSPRVQKQHMAPLPQS